MLVKAATIKRFEYSPLGSELKKQTEIAKDQDKLLKDQKSNVSDNNREDEVKPEDGKAEDHKIGDVGYSCIGDEHKNLISRIFKYGLIDGDLHLIIFYNRHLDLANIIKNYLKKKEYWCG